MYVSSTISGDSTLVDPLNNDAFAIDFLPLYEAMHIYDCLSKGEELKNTYDADRRKQMDLLLPSYLNLDDDGRCLRDLLADIAGFSIIERSTVARTHNFRSVSEIEVLWDILCARVIDLITETVTRITEPRVLLSVKDSVTLFMQTIQVYLVLSLFSHYFHQRYDFSVNQLDRYVLTLFRSYSDILKRRFSDDFNQVPQDQTSMLTHVDNPGRYLHAHDG